MKDSNHLEAYKDPVEEARRYVQNAKDILNDNGKLDTELQLYEDRKYVRMAGNTLWNGVLLILDAVFHVKNKKRQHPDVGDYRDAIALRCFRNFFLHRTKSMTSTHSMLQRFSHEVPYHPVPSMPFSDIQATAVEPMR